MYCICTHQNFSWNYGLMPFLLTCVTLITFPLKVHSDRHPRNASKVKGNYEMSTLCYYNKPCSCLHFSLSPPCALIFCAFPLQLFKGSLRASIALC